MRIFFFIIIICSLFAGCATRPHKRTLKASSDYLQFPDTLKTSPSFKLLVKELSAENEWYLNPNFIPSEKLREKYLLSQINGLFCVKGFIHVNESFDQHKLTDLGGTSTCYTTEIRSFTVPLNRLPEMVKIPGIKYLELARKVNLIKH